jgi:alanine-synthesizing transaminase
MFSSRTEWNTAPNRLSALIAEKRACGEILLDLTESNPTHCGFSYPDQAILSSLADESVLSYHPEPRGLQSARRAIADYYKTLHISINPEQVVLTAGTSEAYSFLFKLICNSGDEVIAPQPSYPLLDDLCRLNDVKLRPYRLDYDGEWHVDFESLQAEFNKRTRAIILVHPNNPTGSFLKQTEFDRICVLAAEHNYIIIADEVFQPYYFYIDASHANILEPRPSVLLFSLNGLSKLLGLPQLKLSWIVVHGNTEQTSEALERLDIIADTFLSVNSPVQTALPKLLRYVSDIDDQIRSRVKGNYKALLRVFAGSNVSVFETEGGWYAILQLPQIHSDDLWAEKILSTENVILQPGHYYGIEHKACLVLSLLPVLEIFDDATGRMCKFIQENSHS